MPCDADGVEETTARAAKDGEEKVGEEFKLDEIGSNFTSNDSAAAPLYCDEAEGTESSAAAHVRQDSPLFCGTQSFVRSKSRWPFGARLSGIQRSGATSLKQILADSKSITACILVRVFTEIKSGIPGASKA